MALLYSGIASHPHPSDQHLVHYITIIKNIFGKLNRFLSDLIKYITKYNRIWVTEKLLQAKHDN